MDSRLTTPDQKAVYHVMSRTALDGFPFQDIEKDRMVEIIRGLSAVYFQQNNKDDFLSLDFGMIEFGEMNEKERLRRYRR